MGSVPDHDWYTDTDPRALEVFLERQRQMSAAEKIAAVFDLNRVVMRLVENHIRRRYPDATEREVFLRAATRRLGPETVAEVYGWTETP
jgi:hypothetical protein